jgi:hypothetical protein
MKQINLSKGSGNPKTMWNRAKGESFLPCIPNAHVAPLGMGVDLDRQFICINPNALCLSAINCNSTALEIDHHIVV